MIVAVSRLEFAFDDFLFEFAKRHEKVARDLARTYPFKIRERVDLLIAALIKVRELRTQPIFTDGFMELNWLGYALDELFEERNAIAHGASFFREIRNERIVVHFHRYVRTSRNTYEQTKYIISNVGLAHLTDRAHALRRYLESLHRFLTSGQGWEENYKIQSRVHDNWRMLKKLGVAKKDPVTGHLYIPNIPNGRLEFHDLD